MPNNTNRASKDRFNRDRANKDFGDQGEDLAAAWYEAEGWIVVDRNYRLRTGEIDVICIRESADHTRTVAFVEVKARSSSRYGGGVAAVGWKKQQTIRNTASSWLRKQRVTFDEIRFDVIEVSAEGGITPYVACF